MTKNLLEVQDSRSFFEHALSLGVQDGRITKEKVQDILSQGSSGIIQIAEYFDTPYLRPGLESARDRMVTLVSLYLENSSQGDFDRAIDIISHTDFLDLSKGGSNMIKKLGNRMENVFSQTKKGDIPGAYALFSYPIPWNAGGNLLNYKNEFNVILLQEKKSLFIKKLQEYSGIKTETIEADQIPKLLFLPVATGSRIPSEYLALFQEGKYDLSKWIRILDLLKGDFPELCEEFSPQGCIYLITDTKEQGINDSSEEDDIDKPNSEWNSLFATIPNPSQKQYITAALTGAISGKMKTTISIIELIALLNKAREKKISLFDLENYMADNTNTGYAIHSIIVNIIEREWNDIITGNKKIYRNNTALNTIGYYLNIADLPIK